MNKHPKKRCDLSFNRYMVECEFKLPPIKLVTHCVLIDTWWNVNQKMATTVVLAH